MPLAERRVPALLVAAPSSGQGKTTVTAALARAYRRQGLRVRVFKCGPDFLDPMILARASGAPVYALDLWMIGEAESRRLLWQAAAEADLILVEGVMGLFDGKPSAADLARCFGLPVLAVIDASGMAQTFAALAHGLATFQAGLAMSGVLANRVGGPRHAQLLREQLRPDIQWYGALPRDADIQLPSRHLGLLQADELEDLDSRLDRAADTLREHSTLPLPEPVVFRAPEPASWDADAGMPLAGVRIGIARDLCFAFIYPANLDLLRQLGAELLFFSPLADGQLPAIDSLYLPGGYPELHLQRLAGNQPMLDAIRAHHQAGKPILAECGGMLYLLDALTDLDGQRQPLLGLLPGEARMHKRLTALAMQAFGELRGHTFHHSSMETALQPVALGECPNGRGTHEGLYQVGRLTASYVHFYWRSSPKSLVEWLRP